jgi:uncharacterized membrane protein
LLHQVLQWHHLLSLVQGDLYRDIRVQILADGLFHAAAYLLAAGGLVLLWPGGATSRSHCSRLGRSWIRRLAVCRCNAGTLGHGSASG